MKKVMLSVLGLSPQVLTEALYALFMQGRMVDEIHVITTQTGRDLIHAGLLASGEGAFFRFLDEYEIPRSSVTFPPGNVHVLRNESGEELPDIVTPEDNEVLVKKCMELAWQLTKDVNQSVYFLIAGGRKTMSACLALAAQFYGRECDRIFHVLVSPEFENCREFYFPPKVSKLVSTKDSNGKVCYRHTKDARIWLVPMPFVSVRNRLSEGDLRMPQEPDILLSALVKDSPPRLIVDLDESRLVFRGRQLDLPPIMTALYAFFAHLKRQCSCKGNKTLCEMCQVSLENIVNNKENQKIIRSYYERIRKGMPYSLPLSSSGIANLDAPNFATYRSKLNKRIEKTYGNFAKEIEIRSWGAKNNKRYGIGLLPKWIEIKGEI